MDGRSQSRKYQLTINSPVQHGITDELVKDILGNMLTLNYFCFSHEVGNEKAREHMHIFLYSQSPIRFGTIKNKFPVAHIERAYGSVKENRDYVAKVGKWQETEKAKTSVKDSFFEWGNCPDENEERAPDQVEIMRMIQAGNTTLEIIQKKQKYLFRGKIWIIFVKSVIVKNIQTKCEKWRRYTFSGKRVLVRLDLSMKIII